MHRGVWQERFSPRFEALENREMRSELPRAAVDVIAQGKHFASYHGLPMAKDPFDRMLYETLFYELQPRTIIELGAYTGASAIWMADVMKAASIDCWVIAVDLDLELVDDAARLHRGVEFREGDLNAVDQIFPAAELEALEGPIVLIDDAHVNICGVYEHFDRYALSKGDYLVIEDTIPWIPGVFGTADVSSNSNEIEAVEEEEARPGDWGEWKWDEVRLFFDSCKSPYLVDRYYTDFFGYNGTWNWNGFLCKS